MTRRMSFSSISAFGGNNKGEAEFFKIPFEDDKLVGEKQSKPKMATQADSAWLQKIKNDGKAK